MFSRTYIHTTEYYQNDAPIWTVNCSHKLYLFSASQFSTKYIHSRTYDRVLSKWCTYMNC